MTAFRDATENTRLSAFSQYAALLKKDLTLEFRTKDMLVSMGVYALLVIIVFAVSLSFVNPGDRFLEVGSGLLWALIIFTALMGLNRSFSHERENGCLEGLLLAPLDRGVVFLAKATSNLIFLLIVEIIAVPLLWLFFSGGTTSQTSIPLLAATLFSGSIGIASIGTLLSTITANVRGKDVMLAILFVPIIFPLLYACAAATTAILTGADVEGVLTTSFALIFGYDVIMTLVAWVLYDFVVGA